MASRVICSGSACSPWQFHLGSDGVLEWPLLLLKLFIGVDCDVSSDRKGEICWCASHFCRLSVLVESDNEKL